MTISQAVLGSKLSVDTVWGKREIKVSEGSPDGLQITIKG
jgi:DnaJ-class molecular chaperone